METFARPIDAIRRDARQLHALWKAGALGGEVMPEDVHPRVNRGSEDLARYFTLGMTLNYQRDSYALWRACTTTFLDPELAWVFQPERVVAASIEDLAEALLRRRVALQPNRHPLIWRRNAEALVRLADGRVRGLFEREGGNLGRVRAFVQEHRASFPYLSGPKLSNYWLYVMSSYMDWPLSNRAALSVAPDRHVIAASRRLGVIDANEALGGRLAEQVAMAWRTVLADTEFAPIDLHTPLWLWSRGGFPRLPGSQGAR